MTLKTMTFVRRPFDVEAVLLTPDNFNEVAEWCGGKIKTSEDGTQYIQVKVARPINVHQTKARAGDWVLKAGTGYKVYTAVSFHKNFEEKSNG